MYSVTCMFSYGRECNGDPSAIICMSSLDITPGIVLSSLGLKRHHHQYPPGPPLTLQSIRTHSSEEDQKV